jgi:AcrR family transcriptional regulator
MSLRQLAADIGLAQGSLYNHIATKQELLFKLILEHMTDLLRHVDEALDGIDDPSELLAAFVEFHVNYHIDRKREVFISYSELRSLEPDNFKVIVDMRRAYEQKLITILKAGAAAKVFAVADAQTTAFGILSMLSGICTWFNPKGRLSKEKICTIYVQMVQRSVSDAGPRARTKSAITHLRAKHTA